MTTSSAGFRGLVVWQKAQDLAVEIVQKLPKERSADILGAQLLRSAGSVAANIAEGYGRFSPGAYRNHLSIARGSLFETESWIDLLNRSGYIPAEISNSLVARCEEVGRLLTTLMKSTPSPGGGRISEESELYIVSPDDEQAT